MSMEEASKEQSASSGAAGKSKLRYPLRSATKPREERLSPVDSSNSSASKRGRTASSVSKSVGVLDLSSKDKPAKPPRRLSIPTKSSASPAPKSVGTITPISEVRKRPVNYTLGKSDTPRSDVSKSLSRQRFNILSSPSYWLKHIKCAETAAKHSVSLGFFKLALEAGCEPQLLRDELKSYAHRHNLVELGETVKDLFECYNISENLEQLQVSETISQVLDEAARSSDDDARSSSTLGARGLKPKSLNTDDVLASSVTESVKKENTQKHTPASRTRGSLNKKSLNSKVASDSKGSNMQKKLPRQSMQESNKGKGKIKKQEKECVEEGDVNTLPTNELQQNKENMDAPLMEEISLAEVI
ncbi:uncharacterized protein LOC131146984 [Malania oleifera]|uniref:uncharacterized protein LOC131146984 n=1 Tax=Malania oleifera TaxID=397392 RepID=UPI0025AEB7A3|nr:uncharacterized protein LOC131146984 [Malania oleifera]